MDSCRRACESESALVLEPEALGPNYELGVHYFDKRMLLHAEAEPSLQSGGLQAVGVAQLLGRFSCERPESVRGSSEWKRFGSLVSFDSDKSLSKAK